MAIALNVSAFEGKADIGATLPNVRF